MTAKTADRTDAWRPFRLVPDDVLFFRDGKPSTRGSDHYLRSIFPPHPFTLYGALRTRRLLDEGIPLRGLGQRWPKLPAELRAELGEWLRFGALEVRGPWLVRNDEVLLPAPGDLLIKPKEREGWEPGSPSRREPTVPPRAESVARLRPPRGDGALPGNGAAGGSSHDLPGLEPHLHEGARGAGWKRVELSEQRKLQRTTSHTVDWWLTPRGLAAWRAGGVPEPEDLIHREELWVDEQRTGVGLESDDRKARDSMIYTFGFVRLQRGVALGFEARNTSLQPGSRVRFGGEARTARLEEGPEFPAAKPDEIPGPGEPARLAFATPALSQSGARPPGFSGDGDEGELGGRPVRVLGAAVGGFTLVGGWDLAKGVPKPLRRAIPAGSVYRLQPRGDAEDGRGLAALDGTCWSDYHDEHLARQGFGLALVGRD